MGRGGRWGVASQLLQQRALSQCSALRWSPLIALVPSLIRVRQRDQSAASSSLPPPGGPTVRPHWCHAASTVAHSGSLAYCATLGGAADHDHPSFC